MRNLTKNLMAMSVVVTVPFLSATTSFAATTSFSSQYQANAAQIAKLLQSIPSSTNTNVTTQLNAVENINSQVEALYSAEQSLESAQSGLQKVNSKHSVAQQLKTLQQQRSNVNKQISTVVNQINTYKHNSKKTELQTKQKLYTQLENQLRQVNQKITALNQAGQFYQTKTVPYGDGLMDLQKSILELQQSEIQSLKQIIRLQKVQKGTSVSTTTQSSDTNIADTDADNGTYVTQVVNTPGSKSITVASNTTASELTQSLQATDGSTQSYSVTDSSGNAITGTLESGDLLKVTAANGKTSAIYSVIVDDANQQSASANTDIEDSADDGGEYVKDIVNTPGEQSLTVADGTTAYELISSIESEDGSNQTYEVTDASGDVITGTLESGDILTVTASDGTTVGYVITVQN